ASSGSAGASFGSAGASFGSAGASSGSAGASSTASSSSADGQPLASPPKPVNVINRDDEWRSWFTWFAWCRVAVMAFVFSVIFGVAFAALSNWASKLLVAAKVNKAPLDALAGNLGMPKPADITWMDSTMSLIPLCLTTCLVAALLMTIFDKM